MFTLSRYTYGAMCLPIRLYPDSQFIGPQCIETLRGQGLKDPSSRGSQCSSAWLNRVAFNKLYFVFRISYFVFRISYFVFRISYLAILHGLDWLIHGRYAEEIARC